VVTATIVVDDDDDNDDNIDAANDILLYNLFPLFVFSVYQEMRHCSDGNM